MLVMFVVGWCRWVVVVGVVVVVWNVDEVIGLAGVAVVVRIGRGDGDSTG